MIDSLTANNFYKTDIKVQWADMDVARHVNNANYFKWAESARIGFYEALQAVNLNFENISIILAWQDCKYIAPVTYPDSIILTYDIISLMQDRIIGECRMYSEKNQQLVAISKSTVMAYDFKSLKKTNIPGPWKKSILDIYGEAVLKE